jgi:hypothetical protein
MTIEERVTALEIAVELIQRSLANIVDTFDEVDRRLKALEAK